MALLVVLTTAAPSHARQPESAGQPEDSLRIYAARLAKTPPLKPPFTGYAIYLGRNAFLSAAHVVGRWPLFTRPRILVDGQDLPATVIKMGFSEDIDLTLVTVDAARLPISLRLRRTPLCKAPPVPGEVVFGVTPDRVTPTHTVSPLLVAPEHRKKFNTLTSRVVTPSGSGIFRATTKCLLGIVSTAVPRFRMLPPTDGEAIDERAGYFVSATKIMEFLPKEFRY